MFNTDQPRGKRRFSTPSTCTVKSTAFHFFVLSEPTLYTPKGSEEIEFAHAGLGKRMLSLADHLKHSEIVSLVEDEYSKLKTLKGGWMFSKGTGGSGRRKLTIIPIDSEGYSTRVLKAASKNGKNTIYMVPIQEHLSTEPLPYDSPEFSKMPQSTCITCGSEMPLQLLPLHVGQCSGTITGNTPGASLDEDCHVIDQPVEPTTGTREGMGVSFEVCPICLTPYPFDILLSHASTCGDRMGITHSESASPTRREELPGPSVQRLSIQLSAAHMNKQDPWKACQLFREELLDRNSEHRRLSLTLDMFDEPEEQDSSLISFYKMNNVNWAAPFKCHLRGDAAVGEGVNRHVLSLVMQKLKTGFSINLGSAGLTTLFEGEKEHRVPSAAAVLRASNLFEMAGRMIGHSVLHGGPGFSGLSSPVVKLLTGRHRDTAASALTLQDCPDLDHRETIALLTKAKMTAAETTSVTDLCLSWDLPVPSPTNHDWLFQELLTQAVLDRVAQPIKQIRKGLKDTGIWPLLSDRPDVHPIIFPREADEELDAQTVIKNICWPKPTSDSDQDEEDCVPFETVTLITEFLRKFIVEASPEVLRDLVKFWVGWEQLTTNLIVEVVTSTYPVAHTCFSKLKLPSHYRTYIKFHDDLSMCIRCTNSGFGLV
ncbi:uncharacterized protein LOC124484669 isoform X1 [Hypomesus transpacificus]|uniref:uncharacterized protein LOC124484669 isoform X1 n=2 Tax=Hypomesus transpacificus TaxID=137520 RepID=UPI001F07667C|nr:uncharacterized protein LOC124484669 isoform X1 [Hypomesus transpacificus]